MCQSDSNRADGRQKTCRQGIYAWSLLERWEVRRHVTPVAGAGREVVPGLHAILSAYSSVITAEKKYSKKLFLNPNIRTIYNKIPFITLNTWTANLYISPEFFKITQIIQQKIKIFILIFHFFHYICRITFFIQLSHYGNKIILHLHCSGSFYYPPSGILRTAMD